MNPSRLSLAGDQMEEEYYITKKLGTDEVDDLKDFVQLEKGNVCFT